MDDVIKEEYERIGSTEAARQERAVRLYELFGSPPERLPDKFNAHYRVAINELARSEYSDAQLIEYFEIAKKSTRVERFPRGIPHAICESLRTLASLQRASNQADEVLERSMSKNEKKGRGRLKQESSARKSGAQKRRETAEKDAKICRAEAKKIRDGLSRKKCSDSYLVRTIQKRAREGSIKFSDSEKIPSDSKIRRALAKKTCRDSQS